MPTQTVTVSEVILWQMYCIAVCFIWIIRIKYRETRVEVRGSGIHLAAGCVFFNSVLSNLTESQREQVQDWGILTRCF